MVNKIEKTKRQLDIEAEVSKQVADFVIKNPNFSLRGAGTDLFLLRAVFSGGGRSFK